MHNGDFDGNHMGIGNEIFFLWNLGLNQILWKMF